jgi:hypothetical protein
MIFSDGCKRKFMYSKIRKLSIPSFTREGAFQMFANC